MRELTEGRRWQFYYIAIAVIAIAYAVVMAIASGYRGLNIDEIYEIWFCQNLSFTEAVTIDPYSCPLFTALAWIQFRIVPYGKLYLRLFTIIVTSGALVMGAECGRRIGGYGFGILVMLLEALTLTLGNNVALYWRPYALYMLETGWVLFLFLGRLDRISRHKTITTQQIVLAGVAMTILGYTHYMGLVFCAIIFIIEIALLVTGDLRGKSRRIFLAYAGAVIAYLPWLIFVASSAFATHVAPAVTSAGDDTALSEYNPNVVRNIGYSGDEASLPEMLDYLCCGHVNSLIFMILFCILAFLLAIRIAERKFRTHDGLPQLVVMIICVAMLLPFYLLATTTDIMTTFWTERYFVPIIPCIAIVNASALRELARQLAAPHSGKWLMLGFSILLVCGWGYTGVTTFLEELNNGDAAMYEPIAKYLLQQDDIQDEKVAWVTHSSSRNRQREIGAWVDYVINQNGKRDYKINVVDGNDETTRDNYKQLMQYEKIYETMNSNNFHFPHIRKNWRNLMRRYYVLVDEYLPYPDRHPDEYVRVYVRKDVWLKEYLGITDKEYQAKYDKLVKEYMEADPITLEDIQKYYEAKGLKRAESVATDIKAKGGNTSSSGISSKKSSGSTSGSSSKKSSSSSKKN